MAQATVTLATTTTTARIAPGDTLITLASLSGVTPGVGLFIDAELLVVASPVRPNGLVPVLRGREGSASGVHAAGATVTIGRLDQFYGTDPVGVPPLPPPVLPYINVVNGSVWQPVGDEAGPSQDGRSWQKQIAVITAGALGANVTTVQGEI